MPDGSELAPELALVTGSKSRNALNQWERTARYLERGEVEIDDNRCENGIRPIAVGRKNWLHIGGEEAGPKIAGIISIMEICRRLDINVALVTGSKSMGSKSMNGLDFERKV